MLWSEYGMDLPSEYCGVILTHFQNDPSTGDDTTGKPKNNMSIIEYTEEPMTIGC